MTQAQITVRRNFSFTHLAGARHFVTILEKHETQHKDAGFGSHFDLANWYASACFLMSFSAVESALDEVIDDLDIPDAVTTPVVKKPLFDRCDAVLQHLGKPKLDKGAKLSQELNLLRELRNALAHPKAEWSDDLVLYADLTKKLIQWKVPLSPFVAKPSDAFPLGCMSAGASKWAHDTAIAFINHLRSSLGAKPTNWGI
ncbi:hypothetical protein G7076_04995 [Sphingomonas sp. HDW15A]|uniref:hypothetical protein n=1 Tax=Sphingomonas sp. HDW15A TaxID=2714942 RepID=UPI001407C55C|nr:hypothetical protein [Sphingomonas sp. HDW15A]QIK95909.1 hypothetical protein G7076_04995 [Sphingomonas sp. HDW15A]